MGYDLLAAIDGYAKGEEVLTTSLEELYATGRSLIQS